MKNHSKSLIALLIFAAYTVWWLAVTLPHNQAQQANFSDFYWTLPLIGGLYGFWSARKWGGLRSLFGRALIFLSLGLLFQVFGQIYNSVDAHILHVDTVYPSVGDVGFFGAIIMYLIGLFWLARSIRAKLGLTSTGGKLIVVLIPAALLGLSYYLFLHDYQYDFSNPIKVFLDFGYPLGDALYVSSALLILLLSRQVLRGLMQKRVLMVLIALFVQYSADFSFSYTDSRGTHIPGDWVDYLYLCAYLVMTLALISLGNGYYQVSAHNAHVPEV